MSDDQRLRRDKPERIGPLRNWSTLYRGTPTPSSNGTSPHHDSPLPNAESTSSWNKVVTHGVKLGYQVVEEHIRQGQRVAQQVNNRSYTPEKIGNDARELLGRIVHYYTDLGSLWGELADSLIANPDFIGNLLRREQSSTDPQTHPPTPTSSSPPISRSPAIEVVATQPTQVTLDLQADSEGLNLATYGLHAGDPQKPSLTDIIFQPATAESRLLLRVRVPAGQPPGIYTGVVVDKNTNVPRGTIMVQIAVHST